jgi:predicted DNA binding CopG/RHH family protein
MKSEKDDKKLIDSVEAGKWKSVGDVKSYKKSLMKAAKETMAKDQRMNLRISKRDLNSLKAKAFEEGMGYQTLVTSILHKYLSGKLKESQS